MQQVLRDMFQALWGWGRAGNIGIKFAVIDWKVVAETMIVAPSLA